MCCGGGYYCGNELACEVSLQQLREDVQSDGKKGRVRPVTRKTL